MRALAAAAILLTATAAEAHLGSSAIVQQVEAGPYRLLVTVRPPDVVPGRAAVEVQPLGAAVRQVSVVPLPLAGEGRRSPPVPDQTVAGADGVFRGTLWLMQVGGWQVRVVAEGEQGPGAAAVPVPALARGVRTMSPAVTGLLVALLALLVAGVVGIVGAAARDADLAPAEAAGAGRVRRGRVAMAAAAALLVLALVGGRRWWQEEAASYRRIVYRPLRAEATVRPGTPATLRLALEEPGWLRLRKLDDLLPDHGHLMHLFAVRWPDHDVIAHLHPEAVAPGAFEELLPALPPGRYRLFGDIVHATGLDETVTASLDLTGREGAGPPGGDDSVAPSVRAGTDSTPRGPFSDGTGALRWVDPPALVAGRTVVLAFAAEGPDGAPLPLEPYMGMAGHAMFLGDDGSVFAHVHPSGSVPMAALALTMDQPAGGEHHHAAALPPGVSFPYLFPRAGAYRLFVQVKHAGRVETAAFDLQVRTAP